MEPKCFCHLAEIKKEKLILENDKFFSIYDATPVNKGHAIVIPKKHILSFFEIQSEEVKLMHEFIIKVKEQIDKDHHPDRYNIGINDETTAS